MSVLEPLFFICCDICPSWKWDWRPGIFSIQFDTSLNPFASCTFLIVFSHYFHWGCIFGIWYRQWYFKHILSWSALKWPSFFKYWVKLWVNLDSKECKPNVFFPGSQNRVSLIYRWSISNAVKHYLPSLRELPPNWEYWPRLAWPT